MRCHYLCHLLHVHTPVLLEHSFFGIISVAQLVKMMDIQVLGSCHIPELICNVCAKMPLSGNVSQFHKLSNTL